MPDYRIGTAAAGLAGLVCAVLCISPAALAAEPAIGGATVVKNDVRSKQDGRPRFAPLVTGGRVFTDDLVQTRLDSMTKIVFLDTTNMSVGPDSIVKLDKFVYNGDGTAKDVAINATKGAFRFFSGKSPSKAYQVSTPQAVIGVRGTTYDVRVTDGVTLVVLQEGEVNVCVRNTARCRVLNQPGQSVSVDNNDITDPLPPANKPWDFASHCANGAADLCNKTTQFALAPLPPRNASPARATPQRAAPVRRASRPTRNIRPPRRVVRPLPPPRRRVVRSPVYDEPIYDPRPGRGVYIDDPVRVRPRPCAGYWRRGRCVSGPVVRPPRPNPCKYSARGCGVRPPQHGRPDRPVYRPRPGYGRPIYRPRGNGGRVLQGRNGYPRGGEIRRGGGSRSFGSRGPSLR